MAVHLPASTILSILCAQCVIQMHLLLSVDARNGVMYQDFGQNAWAASAINLADIGKYSMKLVISTGRLFHVSIMDRRIPTKTPEDFGRMLDTNVFALNMPIGECAICGLRHSLQ